MIGYREFRRVVEAYGHGWTERGSIEDKRGHSYAVSHREDEHGRHHYVAHEHGAPSGTSVAQVDLKRGNRRAMHIGTVPEHRRKGIMSALHRHVEAHLGHRLEPDWATTPDGEAFYKSRSE